MTCFMDGLLCNYITCPIHIPHADGPIGGLSTCLVTCVVNYFILLMFIFRYNLKKDVRESLFDACNEWTKAVGQKRKFMGGDQPNLADLVNELYMHYPQNCTASCISKSSHCS